MVAADAAALVHLMISGTASGTDWQDWVILEVKFTDSSKFAEATADAEVADESVLHLLLLACSSHLEIPNGHASLSLFAPLLLGDRLTYCCSVHDSLDGARGSWFDRLTTSNHRLDCCCSLRCRCQLPKSALHLRPLS